MLFHKISVEEACAFLECQPAKLFELLRLGVVPGLQDGKAWVIPREAFISSVNARSINESNSRAVGARTASHTVEHVGINQPVKIVTPRLWREKGAA